MGRYCYSREIETIEGKETFATIEMASFDEAKKAVDKGIHDRRLELAEKHFDVKLNPPTGNSTPPSGAGPVVELKDATPGSDAPADLPDSPDKLAGGEEGKA